MVALAESEAAILPVSCSNPETVIVALAEAAAAALPTRERVRLNEVTFAESEAAPLPARSLTGEGRMPMRMAQFLALETSCPVQAATFSELTAFWRKATAEWMPPTASVPMPGLFMLP
jgi:hypothetical protein